jgi:glycosyltransferase involved in cell wall biosynthesis
MVPMDTRKAVDPTEAARADRRGRETLTVAITAKDAGHLLDDCLASVSFADEIIVVDMFSTDSTDEVCAAYPQCRLIRHQGYMQENLNIAFDEATSDWILRIDTDERLTPELAVEIQDILRHPPDGVSGFAFWERPIILGRELKYGFGRRHHRKVLFRRGTARYPVRDDHEDLESTGVWRTGRHGYLHYNYTAVRQYLEKMNYYTENDSARAELNRAPRARDVVVEGARQFYLYYVKYQGYRDGWVGFVDAGMRAFYQFVYWAKLRDRWERERVGKAHAA